MLAQPLHALFLGGASTSRALFTGVALITLCSTTSHEAAEFPSNVSVLPCSAMVVRREPLRLADTSWVWLDLTSAVENESQVALFGTQAAVWRQEVPNDRAAARLDSTTRAGSRRAMHRLLPVSDSVIGTIVDRDGHATLLRNPRPNVHWLSVQAARATPQQWHVILVSGTPSPSLLLGISDVEIWYAKLAGSEWLGLQRVATAAHAEVIPPFVEGAASEGDSVAFTFIGRDTERAFLVLLRREGAGSWRHDTLFVADPDYVRTMRDVSRRRWLVLAAHWSSARTSREPGQHLFMIPFDTTWGQEELLAVADRGAGVATPMAVVGRRQIAASWLTQSFPRENRQILWTVRRRFANMPTLAVADTVLAGLEQLTSVMLLGQRGETDALLWLAGGVGPRDRATLVFADHERGRLRTTLPFGLGISPRGLSLRNGDYLVFTDAQQSTSTEPPMFTAATELRVLCKQGH